MYNMTLSFNPTTDMNTTEFKRRVPDYDFIDIAKVLRLNGRYSPFIFANNYRNSDNYTPEMTNCIVLDFDDGITIDEFKERANFLCAIGTTKSHMIEKNGKVCERFRVIIPTETAINLSSSDHYDLMKEVFEVWPEADTACKDTARAYSGHPGAEVYIHDGPLFVWEEFYDRVIKRRELREWQKQEKAKARQPHENEGEKIDWYRENWLSDKMRVALKVDTHFSPGNRNTAIYSFTRFFKDLGLTDSEIVEAIEWINNNELDEQEIKQVLKGQRIQL